MTDPVIVAEEAAAWVPSGLFRSERPVRTGVLLAAALALAGCAGKSAGDEEVQGVFRYRASDPRALDVIDRYLQAIGGEEILSAIRDRVQEFEVTRPKDPDGITALSKTESYGPGGKFREEIRVEAKASVFTYDGSSGAMLIGGKPIPLDPGLIRAKLRGKAIDDPFRHLAEEGLGAKYLGTDEEGRERVAVEGGLDSLDEVYFFSARSGLLLRKEWTVPGAGAKRPSQVRVIYGKYRKVPFSDGSDRAILVPGEQQLYENGVLRATQTLERIRLNGGVDDAIFEKP
jgi:hypothetical protein